MSNQEVEAVAETAKAAQALAPILGKPVEAVTDALRFVGRIIGGPLSFATAMLGDWAYARQTWGRLRIIEKTQKLVEGKQIPGECIPPGFLVPFFEASGNAQDDPIQDLWAALLASAMTSEEARNPAFIQVLRSMSPDDAYAFKLLFKKHPEFGFWPEQGTWIRGPEGISIEWAHLNSLGVIHIFTQVGSRNGLSESPWTPTPTEWKMAVTAFGLELGIALGIAPPEYRMMYRAAH